MEPAVPSRGGNILDVLSHLPVAVGIIDTNGAVRFVNAKAEALYGWRAEEVVGRSALALSVTPTDTAAAADLLARVQLGESWQGRFPLVRHDGSHVPAWMAVMPLPPVDGEEPELMIVAVDVSELGAAPDAGERAAAARAEDANLLLQALLDSVPVGMALFDRSLRFVRVNAAIADFDGVPAEAHVGQPLERLFRGLPPEVGRDIAVVFETGQAVPSRELSVESPHDRRVPRDWVVSYYPVHRGGAVHWVGAVVVEVTAWRRSERERAALLDSEQRAREAAERSADRLARLQRVTARLAEVQDSQDVADVVVHETAAGAEATAGAMSVVQGDEIAVVRVVGMDPDAVARFERVAIDAPVPSADAIRRRELILMRSLEERDAAYPSMVGVPAANRSFAVIPMVVAGRAVGCLALGWPEEREFDDDDAEFFLALGAQAAQALDRGRLYDDERAARAQAEAVGERMRFLADASSILASTLDYEATLRDVARIAVPEVADACLVHLVEDGDVRLVIASHRDPALAGVLSSIVGGPNRGRRPQLLGRVAVSGEPVILDEIPESLLERVSDSPAQLQALVSLDLTSAVVVPLRVQDRVLGVLTLAADATSGRRFGPADLPFMEDLAARAATAIDNAKVHRERTEVAHTLQQSLLPPHLPEIEGLELAQRYHSMGDVEVGGDFFDVFPAGDGQWGVVMGDVCGKGVGAASLTALARYTVRGAAIGGDPAGVLRVLNRAILDSGAGERFCTIVLARVEPLGGDVRVELVCGGHPLPLLLTAAGEVRAVGVPGTAMGLFEEIELTAVDLLLHPGDVLVLYTDGVTEARAPDGAFDAGLLERSVAGAAGGSAEEVASAVEQAVLHFEEQRSRDDMALLVLKVPSTPI